MDVVGTFYIGLLQVQCECGNVEDFMADDMNEHIDEHNIYECPNCGKRIIIDCAVDESTNDDIYFEELDDDEDE